MTAYVLLPANHALFQLANSFLFVSYLSTNILFLRIVLALASLCFALWGAVVLAVAVDTVVWNSVFFLINAAQACIIIYTMIPIRMPRPELEAIYQHWFEGANRSADLTRHKFKPVACCAEIIYLPSGANYASPGTFATHLSLLYQGEMMVIQHRTDYTTHVLTQLHPMHFIDSPEWIARASPRGSRFDVMMKTLIPCTIVRWKYEDIDRILNKDDGTFRHVLASLIGQDLARKVFASNRSVWRFPRTHSPHVVHKKHHHHHHKYAPEVSPLDPPLDHISHIELTRSNSDSVHDHSTNESQSFYDANDTYHLRIHPSPSVDQSQPTSTHYCTFLISPLTTDLVKAARSMTQ